MDLKVGQTVYFLKLNKYYDHNVKCQRCRDILKPKYKSAYWDLDAVACIQANDYTHPPQAHPNRLEYATFTAPTTKHILPGYRFSFPMLVPVCKKEVVTSQSHITKLVKTKNYTKFKTYNVQRDFVKEDMIGKLVFLTKEELEAHYENIKNRISLDEVGKDLYDKRKQRVSTYCYDIHTNLILLNK